MFQQGVEASVAIQVNADGPFADEVFKTAQRRLDELCSVARGSLQLDEWYLYKHYVHEDATWRDLAEEFNLLDPSRQPIEDDARLRLAIGIEQ